MTSILDEPEATMTTEFDPDCKIEGEQPLPISTVELDLEENANVIVLEPRREINDNTEIIVEGEAEVQPGQEKDEAIEEVKFVTESILAAVQVKELEPTSFDEMPIKPLDNGLIFFEESILGEELKAEPKPAEELTQKKKRPFLRRKKVEAPIQVIREPPVQAIRETEATVVQPRPSPISTSKATEKQEENEKVIQKYVDLLENEWARRITLQQRTDGRVQKKKRSRSKSPASKRPPPKVEEKDQVQNEMSPIEQDKVEDAFISNIQAESERSSLDSLFGCFTTTTGFEEIEWDELKKIIEEKEAALNNNLPISLERAKQMDKILTRFAMKYVFILEHEWRLRREVFLEGYKYSPNKEGLEGSAYQFETFREYLIKRNAEMQVPFDIPEVDTKNSLGCKQVEDDLDELAGKIIEEAAETLEGEESKKKVQFNPEVEDCQICSENNNN